MNNDYQDYDPDRIPKIILTVMIVATLSSIVWLVRIEDKQDTKLRAKQDQQIIDSQKKPLVFGSMPDGRQIKGVYIRDVNGFMKLIYVIDGATTEYMRRVGKQEQKESVTSELTK